MNKRKRFTKSLLVSLITAVGVFSSCSDLGQDPYGQQTPENFYANAEQVTSAYVLPYVYMQSNVYQIHFQVHEFVTDEAVVPARYGYVDQEGQWIRFHRHTWTSDDNWIELEWNYLFQAIGYCNQFLSDMEETDLGNMNLPVSKEQMIAEVKMVRALHYYWALSSFGNVPIIEEVGVPSPETQPSSAVFQFIEQEIQDNLPLLSEKGDPNWYGHFTKSAARALLSKLYINAEVFTGTPRWADAITTIDAVLNANYSLDPNWNDPFAINNQSSDENILVVPFDANNAQGFNFIQQNLHENILFAKYNVDWYGWHKISSQKSFYELFDENDARINQWVVGPQTYVDENGEEQPVMTWGGEPMVVTPEINQLISNDGGEAEGVMNVKYEIQPGGLSHMSNDMVIFRLADLMLMKAEALMRQNGGSATQEAVDLVNQVRARSFDPGAPGAMYSTSTLTLDELLDERGRELAYEMHRREDLIRFDKFTDAWWEKDASEEYRKFFPIPVQQLTANPNLEQNPGY